MIIRTSLLLLAIGLLYIAASTRYPPIGKLIDIGGYRLHLHSTGKGGPVVILDAGLGGTSLGWTLVQEEVAKHTQVCSYDRAGYAWSEKSPLERTSIHIAEELHALLHRASIPGPYILVGHSFGGCNMLLFADLYPKETIGVILVDSVQEEMGDPSPQKFIDRPLVQWFLSCIRGPSKTILQMFQPLPEEARKVYLAQMKKIAYAATVSKEMELFPKSLRQLKNVHLNDKPLIVITAGIQPQDEEGGKWSALQKKLLLKSDRSEQIIAQRSDHMINHHQPEIIAKAILKMVFAQRCSSSL